MGLVKELVKELEENNINISLDNNDLQLNYDGAEIAPEILSRLRENKADLVNYLKKYTNPETFHEIPCVEKQESYSLSSSQFRIWVVCQSKEVSVAYNTPTTLHLQGNYNIELLKKAIKATVLRHESLRTVFKQDTLGNVKQHIVSEKEVNINIGYQDLRENLDSAEIVKTYVKEDGNKPFNLEEGPLLRAMIFQTSDEEYVFYYNMHHIISDGWSMNVLSNDVLSYYKSFVKGVEPLLLPLNIHYKDYAAWQLAQLKDAAFNSHKSYWQETLSGELPLLDLPTNKLRPTIKTNNGHGIKTFLNKEMTSAIKRFSKDNDGSLFMGLLSVCNILFHKYTSEHDFIVGTPVAGRNHADLNDQIGIYVNNLALRNQVNPKDDFVSFFEKVKDSTLHSYEHQMYPFDQIVEDLSLKRDISRSPIFDAVVSLQNANANSNDISIAEDKIDSIVDSESTASKVDIAFYFQEVGECLSFNIVYNTDVYERDMVERMMKHYKQLLAILLSSPNQPIQQIKYLTDTEQNQILLDFNNTSVPYPTDKTLVDLFQEQVSQTPDNIALVYKDKEFTYQELDVLSNQLAHLLIDKYKVSVGDLVGIHLERSELFIVSILGILKSGGAYVPIDPEYPVDRKKYMITDSNIKLLLINANHLFDIDYFSGTLFAVDVEFDSSNYSSQPINGLLSSSDLAYLIYTSGSTGAPKGVMIEHKGIANTARASIDMLDLKKCARSLQFASYSFDASVFEIFNALLSGSGLYIIEDSKRKTPEALEAFIKENKIETATLPPSYLKTMEMENLKELKVLVTAGEPPVYDKVLSYISNGGTFFNAYGPTETSICASAYKVNSKEDLASVTIPMGVPIPNATIYILDIDNNIQPIGVEGEICVGGAGLARGYLNRTDLTNEKFINNPFKEGEKLYKTGDVGKWLSDGNIEFTGRKDDQVKIRGYRIELGEIEFAILEDQSIQQVVVDVKGTGEDKAIVAYIETNEDYDQKELHNRLSAKLPNFMMPKYYVVLDQIPLTSNNKVDRKLLPEVGESNIIKENYIAPSSEEEKVLVQVCEDVLKRNHIGVNDNFYNLGGDSIKAIQVVARLKVQGYKINVEDILKTPVLANLSKCMTVDVKKIDQSEVTGEVLLTPIQKFFFGDSNFKVPTHFNQSVLLKSKELIYQDALAKAITDLVIHHDALRMVYQKEETLWKQYNKDTSSPCYSIDFYDLRGEKDEVETMGRIGESLQSSIDLENGPILKVGHFRLSDGDRVGIIIHHLVIDGVSWRILLEDLSYLYSVYKEGGEVNLPLKTDSFQYWADAQNEYAKGPEIAAEIEYWKNVCKQEIPDMPQDEIPASTKGIKSLQSGSFTINKEITEVLQTKIHGVYNTEINDVLLTGLGMAIQETFGVGKSVIKMEGHGREEIIENIDVSRTVGWFTTVHPFILDVSTENATENLVRVKEALRKVPNKGIGYGILRYLTDESLEEITPSIVFNYLGDFGDNAGNSDTSIFDYTSEYFGRFSDPENKDNMNLDVTGILVSGELSMTIKHSKSLYSAATIDKLTKAYEKNLITLIKQLSLEDKSFITPSDLTFKGLTTSELSKLNEDGLVEDIYKLSPLQQGIYYHWLSDTSSTMYFEQVSYRIKGIDVDISSIQRAYKELIDRYPVLRTSFVNDYAGTPLQVVKKSTSANFTYKKVPQDVDKENIAEYIEKIKLQDRQEGFNLEEPSQMRLIILDLGNNDFEFIWSHHHILMDGWCLSILINDFYQLLYKSGNSKDLPIPTPYSNYIQWLEGIDRKTSAKYWKEYLSDYQSVVNVPFKKTENNTNQVYKANQEVIKVKGDLLAQLNQLCKETGITQNTFIQGVWGYLLSRYNSTQDVVFGSVVSGRPAALPGVENMIGLFINTIPVRVKYKKEDSAIELLKSIQEGSIVSTPHHYLTLSEIQSQTNLGSDLMNHILVFENYPIQDAIKEDFEEKQQQFEIESVDVIEQTNYSFEIIIGTSETSMSIDFNYDSRKYDADLMKLLSQHFYNLMEQFIKKSDKKLRTFKYINKEEEELQLHVFNKKTQPLNSSNKTVIDVLEDQVIKTPNTIALVFEGDTITYAELDQRSNQLARYLLHKGIQSGDLVGICLDRSLEMVISILGILKAGGCYIPIDPQYPASRINYIIEDTGMNFLIGDSLNKVKEYQNVNFLYIDKDSDLIAKEVSTTLDKKPCADQLAYVIYTSGSTGEPKGVMVSHSNLYAILNSELDLLSTEKDMVACLQTNYVFDVSLLEIFLPILRGGKLVIPSTDVTKDMTALLELCIKEKVTILQGTPTFFSSLLLFVDDYVSDNLCISKVCIGGESLTSTLVDAIRKKLPQVTINNHYGPTETTIDAFVLENIQSFPSNNIGVPIHNVQAYILDANDAIAPVGIAGELCIGGTGVTKGYLNKPELTQEKFVTNPFIEGAYMYRTGDIGKWMQDGTLEFIGRKDNQVKIRGHRIELGEIEYQLQTKEEIVSCVVVVKKTSTDNQELIAYIVSTKEMDIEETRVYLSGKLPSYMIPNHIIQIKNMPLTVNGKIDKKALLSLQDKENYSKSSHVAPKTEEEKILVTAWEETLEKENISILDNFFQIGGDSIKSLQLVSRLKQKGYTLKVNHVIVHSVLQEMAKYVQKGTSVINQSEIVGDVELTPIQLEFFKDPAILDHHHYNQPVILKSDKILDKENIKSCLDMLVRHHDALRMVYKNQGQWSQFNQSTDSNSYDIEYFDLRESKNELNELRKQGKILQASINLEKGPLIKVGHFSLSDGDRLVLVVHHLVVDAVSWRILLEDLATLYKQNENKEKPNLPLKTDAFQHWAYLQKQYAQGNEIALEKQYWQSLCKEKVTNLPIDKGVFKGAVRMDTSQSFLLDKETTKTIQKVTGEQDVTIKNLLITSLGLAIKDVFGVSKTAIKMEGHGREAIMDTIDISRTVGWFTTVYPFVLDVTSDNLIENLNKVQDAQMQIPNNGIGYGIVKHLTNTSLSEIKQSVEFNYLGDFGSKVAKGTNTAFKYVKEDIGSDSGKLNGTDTLLNVSGMIAADQLSMVFSYSDALHDPKTITNLIDRYQARMQELVKNIELQNQFLTKPSWTNKNNNNQKVKWEVGEALEISENQKIPIQNIIGHGRLGLVKISNYLEETFEGKFREFLSFYPVLRIGFEKDKDEKVLQRILSSDAVKLKIKAEKRFEKEDIHKLEEKANTFFNAPYEIFNKGELIRIFLVIDSQDTSKASMFVAIHHSITDMYSNSILHKNLQEFFNNKNIETDFISNFEFAVQQKHFLSSASGIDKRKYWVDLLSTHISAKTQKYIEGTSANSVSQKMIITGSNFEKIMQNAAELNLPSNALFMAAHQLLLQQVGNGNKCIQTTLVTGREQEMDQLDVTKVLGVISNDLPLPVIDPKNKSSKEYSYAVYNQYIESKMYEQVPFEIIREDYKEKAGIDILDYTAGEFNFQVFNSISDTNRSHKQVDVQIHKEAYTKGIDVVFVINKNSITLQLTCPKDMYDSNTLLQLDNFVERKLLYLE